jgi:hypothetical protein
MFGEGEGGVEFNPMDPVGFLGINGRDGGVVRDSGNKVFLHAGGKEGAVGEGEGVAFTP